MRKQSFMLSLFLVMTFLFCGSANAKVLFVAQDTISDGSGASWDNACSTISAGLALSASGDEIWVKAGRYSEKIVLAEGVSLYGGFSANETSKEERDWISNETIIDATGSKGHAVECECLASLDGFTVTNGSDYLGAGIHVLKGSLSLSNCRVERNFSTGHGGGIYCEEGVLDMKDCSVNHNTAEQMGAGVFIFIRSEATVINCRIANNIGIGGSGGGAGLYISTSSAVDLSNSIIENNWAGKLGGGIYVVANSVLNCTNSLFLKNYAQRYGGALYLSAGDSTSLFNCTLFDNRAGIMTNGIHCTGNGSLTCINSVLWNQMDDLKEDFGRLISVEYSCTSENLAGNGNINLNPEFVSTDSQDAYDIHLLPNSPCIDSGTNLLAVTKDIEGTVRPYDVNGIGFDGNNQGWDMGAYEFRPLPGDIDDDGTIGVNDLIYFSKWWEMPTNETNFRCDIIQDQRINEKDLLEWLTNYSSSSGR